MTDKLPSIEDLLKASQGGTAPSVPVKMTNTTAGPDDTTEIKLEKKIEQLSKKGREEEVKLSANVVGVQYINLVGFPVSPDALTQIPKETAEKLKCICFLFTGPEIRLAATDPSAPEVVSLLHSLEERHKAHGGLYQMSEESFASALKLYDNLPKVRVVVKGVQITESELEKFQAKMTSIADISEVLKTANITDVLTVVIAASLRLSSSDIHIEAEENDIAVRFRVDGILQTVGKLEKSQWKKIINRIKLVAGLKLNVIDRPQDGRFTIFQKEHKIDVRASTIPTSAGESVVMRILNSESIQLDLTNLGFRPPVIEKLMKVIEQPNGMIVTTGPTGSGKTTTLYAILQHLNKPEVKILTLEDPVEYKMDGINQSQIDASKDYTFAKGLRSILRQDPDIVMVGEIRDLETAETAIQAALTGHLLISTIHTNDAAGAIPRFVSMGVKPFLLAPALTAIMGQRLARKLCTECKKPADLDEATKAGVLELLTAIPEASGEKPDLSSPVFYQAVGCEACNNTGYKGRVGLYELLLKDSTVEKFILEGTISEFAVRDIAVQQGMVTMAQDGLLKALEGVTTVDEVKRVAGF